MSFILLQGIDAQHDPNNLLINKNYKYVAVVSQVTLWAALQTYIRYNVYGDYIHHAPLWKEHDFKSYMQMDMARHMFGSYWGSKLAYDQYRNCGVNKNVALIVGGSYGFLLHSPKEYFDARYLMGSKADLFSNFIGSAFFVTQELLFKEQPVLMKVSYFPSDNIESKWYGIFNISQAPLDYNAYTFWLSVGIKDAFKFEKIPAWLDLSFGYGVDEVLGEFRNPAFPAKHQYSEYLRTRQYLFSLDIDLSEINTRYQWLNKVFDVVNIIKFPFPAVEYNKNEGLVFHYLYF